MALQKQAHPKHLEIQLTLQIHLRPPSDTQTSKQRYMRPIHTSLISFSGETVQMNKCTKKNQGDDMSVREKQGKKITTMVTDSCIIQKWRG